MFFFRGGFFHDEFLVWARHTHFGLPFVAKKRSSVITYGHMGVFDIVRGYAAIIFRNFFKIFRLSFSPLFFF